MCSQKNEVCLRNKPKAEVKYEDPKRRQKVFTFVLIQ